MNSPTETRSEANEYRITKQSTKTNEAKRRIRSPAVVE